MSAGDPGTMWSETLQCWIADPDFVPTRATFSVQRARSVISTAIFCTDDDEAIDRRIERGDKMIDRIHFWMGVPVIGNFMANRLAHRLDAISDYLDAASEEWWEREGDEHYDPEIDE